MNMLFKPVLAILCCLLLSACGMWTHYTPVDHDNSYRWYSETSTLYLQNDSTLSVIASLPEFLRDTKRDSLLYDLAISSAQEGQVVVDEIYIEVWDYASGEMITPAYHGISTVKGDYQFAKVSDLPDSLRVLRKGQHRIAYEAYIPKTTINKKKNLEMHFYLKATLGGREMIIDRSIRFYRINEPLVLNSV